MSTTIRYSLSFALTFFSTFFTILGMNLTSLSATTLSYSALAAALFSVVRGAFKAATEKMFGVSADPVA